METRGGTSNQLGRKVLVRDPDVENSVMNRGLRKHQKLKPGRLVDVWGANPDYCGYVGTGLVIDTKQFSWTCPPEVLVVINSTYRWFDLKTFIFYEPEQ